MADSYSEKIAPSSDSKANGILGMSDGSQARNEVNHEKGTVDQDRGDSYDVGVFKDGVKLHPQPTADPLDPLNWTSFRKHTILAIVMYL